MSLHLNSSKAHIASPEAEVFTATVVNDTTVNERQGWPEPSPNWLEAFEELSWMWQAHVYGFGSIFAMTTLYAVISLFRLRKTIFVKQKVHLLIMTLLLMAASFGRSVTLFWDPYGSSGTASRIQTLIIIISWGTCTACLTSAFSIMLLIFLETTKTKLGPPRLRNLPFLASVTVANIGYLILSDLVVWFHPKAKVMIFICHVAFATWGLAISAGYFVAGFRMWRNLKPSLRGPSSVSNRCLLGDLRRLRRLFAFMFAASVFGLGNFSVSIYLSIGEFGVFTETSDAKLWPWFATQSTKRLLEILMSALVFLIPIKNQKTSSSSSNENRLTVERVSRTNSVTKTTDCQTPL